MEQYILNAPKFSMKNRKAVESSQLCGCYQCLEIFLPKEIVNWTDQHKTAICPKCGIDSVLTEQNLTLTKDNLKKLFDYWFAK